MFKKMLCIVWLSAFGSGIVLAEEPQEQETTQAELDLQTCDKKEKELKTLQREIFGIKRNNRPLSFYQENHDKSMAELIILKGMKELKERHKKFLRDITDAKGTEINGDLGNLNKVRSELKDGIDVMGRMTVMQDMIDEIIDIESDSNPANTTPLDEMDRKNPESFVKMLVDRCNKKTPKERAFKFKLCAAITEPPSRSKDWGDISKEDKEAIKAEYTKLNGYSDNLIGMVKGFARSYVIRHDQAINDDQAKQKRLAALNVYKESLTVDFPKEFSPENMYNDSIKLDQELLKAADVESTKQKRSKGNLSSIKKMHDLNFSINQGMDQYKSCLGKLRLRALTGMNVETKKSVLSTNNTDFNIRDINNDLNMAFTIRPGFSMDDGTSLSFTQNQNYFTQDSPLRLTNYGLINTPRVPFTLPDYFAQNRLTTLGIPDPHKVNPVESSATQVRRCELSIPQYNCSGSNNSKCEKSEIPNLTMSQAQEQIKGFQDSMTENLKQGINKYTNMANATGEAIEVGPNGFSFDPGNKSS